jgi:copper transport protein
VAIAVVSPSLTGHTRASGPQAPVIATDAVHVLAGSIWLGGLVGLALTLPAVAGRSKLAAQTLARFSTVAAAVLVALVSTGSLLAWRIVASWENLFHTGYGRVLLAKIAVVAVAAAIGGWNRFVLLPRARKDSGHTQQRDTLGRIGLTVTLEAALITVVLALTGFLVNQSPRPAPLVIPDGRTGVQTAALGEDHRVLATITPGRVGQNTVLFQIQDNAGEPLEPRWSPVASLSSRTVDLGEISMTSQSAGTYRADVVIPSPGQWTLQVSVRVSHFTNPVSTATFAVSG